MITTMIKAVIVEDEPPATRELRRMLAGYDDVNVVGDARTVPSARGLLLRTAPDAVFLDVNLSGKSGFDLIDSIDPDTAVVFVTAYDQHAVDAFAVRATDYLMKPVAAARLDETVSRLRQWMQSRHAGAALPASGRAVFSSRRWVFTPDDAQPDFIEMSAIACIEARDEGSVVRAIDGRLRDVARPLRHWEERLPVAEFVRVSRSVLINLAHVMRVEPWSNYSFRVHLRGVQEPVVMSRRRAVALRDVVR